MKGQNSKAGQGSHTAKDSKVSGVLGVIKARGPCSRERRSKRDEMVGRGNTESIHSMDMSLSKLQEIVKNREAWHAVVLGVIKS